MSTRLINELRQTWQVTAKDEVLPVNLQEGQGFRILAQVKDLLVFSVLVIDKKGKLHEHLQVLDTALPDSQQLIVSFTTKRGGMIYRLTDIELDIDSGMEPETACREAMEEVLESSKSNPNGLFDEIMSARNGGYGNIRTVSGGLPTLGKRR